MKCTIYLLAGLTLSGCAATLSPPLSQALVVVRPVTLTPSQVSAVHKAVLARLKDPDSARFGSIAAGEGQTGTIHVCGKVNAKNSYGGYGGMTTYSGELSGLDFRAEGPSNILDFICDKQGLSTT